MRLSTVRWAISFAVLVGLFGVAPGAVQAQLRCTMPNGVKITQQLGSCPRDAVAAEKLDGTPVPMAEALPKVQSPVGVKAPAAVQQPSQPVPASETSGDFSGLVAFLIAALVIGLIMAIKGSGGSSGPVVYCTACGTEGRGKTKTRGSLLIEVVLWVCFLVPGLVYSLWRHSSKHKVCGACGSEALVPLNSPVARAARPSATPPGQQVLPGAHAPEVDEAWEGSFYDVVAQRSIEKTVRIVYRDGEGALSERVVDVRAFEPSGSDGLVIGHCHLRNARRTFRFDRMVRVVDEDTGEVISNLQAVLNAEWEASPEPVLDALYAKHRDLLRVLLYAAKADGAMRAPEVRVIARHCAELTGDDRLTPDVVRELLDFVDLPSITSFVRIYNQLRRERPADAQRAAQACREIVATQKTIHPGEQAMLDALDKPLPKSTKVSATGAAVGA
ncbi:WYL domain-containing protein [Acidovorax sp. BL-A-41-H1]|uniref:WYL domain-containing protein n=1 Tax=Acidovorax sp. BL-A-41-H1 TaxID=3421102 RepID=UPI003F798704